MRYPDCQREDGNCAACSLSSYGRDCRNAPVNYLAYLRTSAGLTQKRAADAAGMNIRQYQKLEAGDQDIETLGAGKAVLLAKALGVSVEELIKK